MRSSYASVEESSEYKFTKKTKNIFTSMTAFVLNMHDIDWIIIRLINFLKT